MAPNDDARTLPQEIYEGQVRFDRLLRQLGITLAALGIQIPIVQLTLGGAAGLMIAWPVMDFVGNLRNGVLLISPPHLAVFAGGIVAGGLSLLAGNE